MNRFLAVLLLCTSTAFAQWGEDPPEPNTVVISAPSTPVQPGLPVPLDFVGLRDDELRYMKVDWDPKAGATVFPQWNFIIGKPYLVFYPSLAGKYTVSVTLHPANEWRLAKSQSLRALRDEKMGPELLAKYDAFAAEFEAELEARFPFKSGKAVIEVAGVRPVDPTDPLDPIDPTKVDRITYIYEKDDNHVPRPVAFALQKINADSAGKITATEFEEDSTVTGRPDGPVPSQYVIALKAAREAGLPALVVQSGSTVVRVIKNPTTTEQVLEVLK